MQAFHRMETISDFAQISGKDSLCEIENALLANHKRLYYLGMEAVAKSTLSEAMNRRNPEIFKALFEEILDRVMAVAPKHKFKFKNPLYAIDSTTLDLCLSREDSDATLIDPVIINIARAFRWQALIDKGKFSNVHELARAIGKDEAYVSRIIRLTLLAPEIIHAILTGNLNKSIRTENLKQSLPTLWEDQKKMFGIE